MAKTEENPLSVILGALAQGVGKLPVEIEKQKTVRAQNAFQNMNLQQQMADQQLQQQKFDMDKQTNKLQQQELTERIRQLAMNASLTKEQEVRLKAKLEREQAESVANINAQGRMNLYNAAIRNRTTTSGKSNDGAGGVLQKFITPLTTMLNTNKSLASTNAGIRQNDIKNAQYAESWAMPIPAAQDTLPHLDIAQTLLPAMTAAGVDPATAATFLQGFGVSAPMPLNNAGLMLPTHGQQQQGTLDNISPEDLLNMTDDELQALFGQ